MKSTTALLRPPAALLFALVAALAAACGSSSTSTNKADASTHPVVDSAPGAADAPKAAVDAFPSTCGMPGDVGNEIGVGKFCQTLTDCNNNKQAPLCSNLGDATTFFCTKLCNADAGVGECGTGATCTCGNGGCGCTPNVCLN